MATMSVSYLLERIDNPELLDHRGELRLGACVQAGQAAKRRLDAGESTDRRADRRAVADGRAARDELVLRNVRLVQTVARRYRLRAGGDPDDLFMYGVLGLFRAAELFDPGKGVRFSTYAVLWVRQAINAALGDESHPLHVPYPQQLKEIRLRALMSTDGMHLERAAAEVGMQPSTARQLLAACAPSVSLDQPVDSSERDGATVVDLVPQYDVGFGLVDDDVAGGPQQEALHVGLAHLDSIERQVVRTSLQDHDGRAPTLDEIAAELGLASTLVRSKRLSARSKLAHPALGLRQQLRSGVAGTGSADYDPAWALQAPCRSVGLGPFFEDLRRDRRGDLYGTARRTCAPCPVRTSCLSAGIAEGLRSGYLGGMIPARRIELRKQAQRNGVAVEDPTAIAAFLVGFPLAVGS
ncbi:MAG: sigma-70 family RNA polymerase sigma factor [Acidimicrobiales bacterium]